MLRRSTLRNRIWRSATWLASADSQGNVTDTIVNTYENIAKGGAAMIVTGLTSVIKDDAQIGGEARFHDDRFVEKHHLLTDAVHRHGSLAMMQTATVDGPIDGLTTRQVGDMVKSFGDAARRAEHAGYDGVQIHAAHFFYLSKFISPLCNHRTDHYGGDQTGRSRILLEILDDMRSKTSQGFIITMKINSTDEFPGGLTQEDFLTTCRLMADSGIDAIEVSGNGTSRTRINTMHDEGYFANAALPLADTTDTPVVLVGGLRSLEAINHFIGTTNIEYVSLSRPLIREPDLINRWQQGDTSRALCVSCNTCYRTPGHQCIFNLNNKHK